MSEGILRRGFLYMKPSTYSYLGRHTFLLAQTFFHIPGFGIPIECSLWEQGCSDWEDFLSRVDSLNIGFTPKQLAIQSVEQSMEALQSKHFSYFDRALGPMNAWRAWPEFRDSCVYLDIETNGTHGDDAVTTIGLYDGFDFQCLIKGKDLEEFPNLISQYSMIITFFGTSFDLPMLRKRFPGISFNQIHLDLCPILKGLGYKGGLKKIEKQVGIARSEETDGLSGYHAVHLWRSYETGNKRSLERLIEYNREDVVNLELLAQIAYEGHRAKLMMPKLVA